MSTPRIHPKSARYKTQSGWSGGLSLPIPSPDELSHPSTEARARHIASGRLDTNAARVLNGLFDHPGSTAAELSRILDLGAVEVRRRLDDLRKRGLAEHADKRKCGVAKTLAFSWRLCPKQMELL